MGWLMFDDDQSDDWSSDHEGYVQAVVRSEWGWRDLSLDDRRSYTCAEFWVQIACECGWRSQRMPAPLGSSWSPCSVAWPADQWDEWDEVARGIWRAEHRDQVTARFRHLCRWPGCTRTGHASAPSVVRS